MCKCACVYVCHTLFSRLLISSQSRSWTFHSVTLSRLRSIYATVCCVTCCNGGKFILNHECCTSSPHSTFHFDAKISLLGPWNWLTAMKVVRFVADAYVSVNVYLCCRFRKVVCLLCLWTSTRLRTSYRRESINLIHVFIFLCAGLINAPWLPCRATNQFWSH